jgi:hypothetical protein
MIMSRKSLWTCLSNPMDLSCVLYCPLLSKTFFTIAIPHEPLYNGWDRKAQTSSKNSFCGDPGFGPPGYLGFGAMYIGECSVAIRRLKCMFSGWKSGPQQMFLGICKPIFLLVLNVHSSSECPSLSFKQEEPRWFFLKNAETCHGSFFQDWFENSPIMVVHTHICNAADDPRSWRTTKQWGCPDPSQKSSNCTPTLSCYMRKK